MPTWSKCAFLVLSSSFLLHAAAKPDFTGKWELVVNQSDFGNSPKPSRMTLESTNKGTVMHSVSTIYTGQDNQTTESDWFVDNKRHPTDKPAPGYSVTRWQDNVLVNERQSMDGSYKETIHLSLSNDGKTATEKVDSKTPNGANHTKLVWRKEGS